MGYVFYISFFSLILATSLLSFQYVRSSADFCAVLYLTRNHWLPLLPIPDYIYYRLPSSFASDIESGFTSNDFDLTSNVAAEDARAGLDQQGKREVQRIMRNRKVGFDEARRIYTEQRFAKNDIGPDGRPRDPKFVSFS